MYKYHCLNPISGIGLEEFTENYAPVSAAEDADAILVRSAGMHEMEFAPELKAIARAGAGVNNIPLDKCAEKGIVVFNTPGANANGQFAKMAINNVPIKEASAVAVKTAP